MRVLVVLCLLVALTMAGYGQPDEFSFEHLDAKSGLNTRYNDFIFKDSRQLLWISSIDGLYCYDGLSLKHYLPDNSLGKGMLGKNIQSPFFEDQHGNIWFSSVEGINCYHREKAVFSSFQLIDTEGNPIKDDYCLIHLEQQEKLWIKTNGFIYQYDIGTKTQKIIIPTKGMRFAVDTLADGRIDHIYACLWDNGSGFEVIYRDQDQEIKKKPYLDKGWGNQADTPIEISGAVVQHAKTAWLFSDQGLLFFSSKGLIEKYELPDTVVSIFKDGVVVDDQHLLLAAKNSGLWLFNTTDKKFVMQYASDEDQPRSLTSDDLREVYLDPQDHLWLSSRESAAIDQVWWKKQPFKNPFVDVFPRLPVVNSMVEDKDKQVWSSTLNNGVCVFDLNGTKKTQFPNPEEITSNGTVSQAIHHLSIDEQGQVWGLGKQFIYRLDKGAKQWRKIFNAKEKSPINLLHLSPSIKILSTNRGVFQLNGDATRIENKIDESNNSQGSQQLIYLFKGSGSMVYCLHNPNHLSLYKMIEERLVFQKELEFDSEIFCVYDDAEVGIVWVGTLDGLVELDKKDWTIKQYGGQHKLLKSAQITNITKDTTGQLWLSTNNRLLEYDPLKDDLLTYTIDDGFASKEFSFSANIKASNESIWLGMNKGLVVFSPASIEPYPHGPELQIASLSVNRAPFTKEGNIAELKHLNLRHQDNTLAFKLVGVGHYLPKQNIIHYQLEGYREDWQQIENGGVAEFTKIPDGKYTLHLYGTNANGVKGPMKSIEVHIAAPFWKTSLFWILALMGTGLAVYALSSFLARRKLRLQREAFERKQALEEALQGERNRIAGEMHDDLGTELTLIGLLLNDIPTKELPEIATENLKKIETHASKSIENMREIIWAMNNSYDNLPDLVAFIRRFVVEIFDDSDLVCKAQIPDGFPDYKVSGEKRRNILLCVKECANNILKHADATHVNLSFKWNGMLEIQLSDNGCGFDTDHGNRFGNGLKSMHQRMNAVGGEIKIVNENGTKISFMIPLEGLSEGEQLVKK